MTSPHLPKHKAEKLLKRATYASVFTAAVLIVVKAFAWVFTGSVAVLASLLDSLMDAGASLINLMAVRYSLQPADQEHRFGHGKAESVAGLAQSMFIAGSGVFLLLEAIDRIIKPQPIEDIAIGIGIMAFSIVATLLLISYQLYVVKKTGSMAIKADALHYKTDLFTNAAIIVALFLTQYGWGHIDPIFAIAIGGYILYSAWEIGSESFHQLLDRELPDEQRQQIKDIIGQHPKILGFHDLRTRQSGRMQIIQMHLEMEDKLILVDAHTISDEVEASLIKAFPNAEIVIHQDPISATNVEKSETNKLIPKNMEL